jgi:hypothetical protein
MGFLIFVAMVAPRIALGALWYTGDRVDNAFSGWFTPALGIIFLPYATIMYVLLYAADKRVEGGEWILVGIAGIVDLVLTVSRLVPKQMYD